VSTEAVQWWWLDIALLVWRARCHPTFQLFVRAASAITNTLCVCAAWLSRFKGCCERGGSLLEAP
jgi:hypothetical protein